MKMSIANSFGKLSSEKKKLVAMLGLIVVGLLLWGRLLIKQVPKTAVADPPQSSLVTPAPPAKGSTTKKVVRVKLSDKLARDLFVPVGYTPGKKPDAVITPAEKSRPEPADENVRIQAVLTAAEKLTLQSTMQGEQPQAVINGQRVRVGQTIEGFQLLEIKPRQVTLRMNGVDVRLEM